MNRRTKGGRQLISLFGLALLLSFATPARPQLPKPGDAPKPRSPEQSAAAFKLPDGFKMELVASEPLIASPSGICWDERGRLFVTELHGYNLEGKLDVEELNKTGKLDEQVRRVQAAPEFKKAAKTGTYGVVKLLRDTDGDGRMDKADVWSANLPPAYGLVPARGGVIVACAPEIVYLADRDDDGRAEVRETLFSGFKAGLLERGVNAPQWGPDGWIYFGSGLGGGRITGPKLAKPIDLPRSDFRIRPDGSAIEPITGRTHTLGFAMTESGERFVPSTTVPGIYVAPLPWRYLIRNPNAASPSLTSSPGGRKPAFSISRPHPWRTKRASHPEYFKFYRDRYGQGEVDPSGWFTSACGSFVYRDNVLPGLQGNLLACEPSGNLIHRALIERRGTELVLKRAPGEEQSEFAASKDGWSHPIQLSHGPDGAIWVVDYYREIIEDYSAIPRHLQQQYDLYAGHDRGRIYRLTHRDAPKPPVSDLSKSNARQLARETASPLYWRRETALRLLVERGDPKAAPELRRVLADRATSPSGVIAALRALDGLTLLKPDDLTPFVDHEAPAVRVHALQLGDRRFGESDSTQLENKILAAARTENHPRVLLQLALSLGEIGHDKAIDALANLATRVGDLKWMDAAVLSSVHNRETKLLSRLLNRGTKAESLPAKLAASITAGGEESDLSGTLTLISRAPLKLQTGILNALARGRAGGRRKPAHSPETNRAIARLAASADADVRAAARALEATFQPRALTAGEAPSLRGLPAGTSPAVEVTEELYRDHVKALSGTRDKQRGHELFLQACATCHRIGEEGQDFGPNLLGELFAAEETLLRQMLFPNERIRPGFETTAVRTVDGEVVTGLLKDEGATSLQLAQPNGVVQTLLRKDVVGVSRVAGSSMPTFAGALKPKDFADLLAWLRSNLPEGAFKGHVLFDEQEDFPALLKDGGGKLRLEGGAASGERCLVVTPLQRHSSRIPGWNFRIVEHPKEPNEFRRLRISWKASGDGVMIELAKAGRWPQATAAPGRYYAGTNITEWPAIQTSRIPPREWQTVVVDLWRDMGEFTLTGIAPTAMGGEARFDRIELLR